MAELENNKENAIEVVKVIAKRRKGRPSKAEEEKKRRKKEYDRKYHEQRYKNDPEYKTRKKLRYATNKSTANVDE